MKIEGIQVGKPAVSGGMRTAFGKRAVTGPIRVGRTNLEGDAQADRRHHGGPDMAVLAYSADQYAGWRVELSWPGLPLGGFGENLSVSGASEESACIGDVWRAGTATLQIASPRKPCRKLSAYWGRPDLLPLVQRSGRVGWYLRVIEEGLLERGDPVELIGRPHPEWTVRAAFAAAQERRVPGRWRLRA